MVISYQNVLWRLYGVALQKQLFTCSVNKTMSKEFTIDPDNKAVR
jgi:hypothetical protein